MEAVSLFEFCASSCFASMRNNMRDDIPLSVNAGTEKGSARHAVLIGTPHLLAASPGRCATADTRPSPSSGPVQAAGHKNVQW